MSGRNSSAMSNSLMRGLLVLERFSPEKPQLSLAELASVLDVPKSSLFRIAKTLSEMGFLRYDDSVKKIFSRHTCAFTGFFSFTGHGAA